jgi:tight adherence protein C
MVKTGAIHGSAGAMIADAGSVLVALAVFFASLALSAFRVGRMDRLIRPVPMRLPSRQGKTGPLESLLTRIGKSAVARTVGQRARLEGRLLVAGEPASVEAVLGAKVMASIGGAALVAISGMAAGLSVPLLALSVPIVLAATRAPEFVLARRARTRQRRIASQVPDLAELLVATTGAGLNPPLAFRRSAEVLEGPLGEELRVAVRGLDLGAEWRTVLDEVADRTGDPSLRRLVRAMGRSQRLGTPLASALHSLAEDLRNERQSRAEDAARRAPVKMLFPLVFLILPAFLLLTVGPVLLATIRSLR